MPRQYHKSKGTIIYLTYISFFSFLIMVLSPSGPVAGAKIFKASNDFRVSNTPVYNFNINNKSVFEAIESLIGISKANICIEAIPKIRGVEDTAVLISMEVDTSTLGKILNDILSFDRRYKWEEYNNCVITVMPTKEYYPDFNPLDIKIEYYECHSKNIYEAINAILQTKEIKKLKTPKGVYPIDLFKLGVVPAHRADLKFKNMTVRQILNEIITVYRENIWLLGGIEEWRVITVGYVRFGEP